MSRSKWIQRPDNHLQYLDITARLPKNHLVGKHSCWIMHRSVSGPFGKRSHEARKRSVRRDYEIVKGRTSQEVVSDVNFFSIDHVFEIYTVLEKSPCD